MSESQVRAAEDPRPPAADDARRRWRALVLIAAAQLLVVLDASVVNIALPSAQADLGMSDTSKQWVVAGYSLTFGGFLLLGGRIADMVGRKRAFLAGLVGFALASAVGGAAQGTLVLLAARATQGAFAALLAPAALALLATTFTEPGERARAFGVFGAAVGTGGVAGMVLGGVLTEFGSWRWCLWVNLPVALAVLVPAVRLLRESRASGPARYDLPGALSGTLGVGLLIYGITQSGVAGWPAASTLGFCGAGLVLLVLFVRIEHRSAQPMMPLRIVRHRVRGSGYFIVFLVGAALYAFYLFLTYYLQVVQGYSPLRTGFAFVPIGAGILVGSLGVGRVVAAWGARTVVLGGLVVSVLGLAGTGLLDPGTGFFSVVFPVQLVVGLGIGAALTTVMKLTLDGVSPDEAGVASALTNAMREIGGAVGISALNVVAVTVTATASDPTGDQALTDGYVAAFVSGAALLALAALVAVVALRRQGTAEAGEPAEPSDRAEEAVEEAVEEATGEATDQAPERRADTGSDAADGDGAGDGGRSALAALLRPVRGRLVLGAVLQAVGAVSALGPFVAIYLIGRALLDGDAQDGTVWGIVLFAVAALIVRFIAESLSYVLMHDADMEFQLRLRRRIAHRLGRLPLGWFGARNSATVKKALADDIDAMHYLVAHSVPDLTAAVITPAAALTWLFVLDWRLTLVTLVTVPVFGVLFRITGRRGGRQAERMAGAVAGINGAVVEFVQGITVIKAFGQRDRASVRFTEAVEDYMTTFTAIKGPLLRLSSVAYASICPAAMLTASLAGGTAFVAAGWAAPLDILPFVLLSLVITAPLVIVTYAPQALGRARQAAARVTELLATPTLPEPETPRVPDGHRVEFRGVTFGYRPENPVLHHLDLDLAPGSMTALVGPSGGGKSTTAALLSRFFDPDRGAVRIGGVDLREMTTQQLYQRVSFVFQDVRLLRTTVADNIRLARPDASLDEVRSAARAARCDERISALPRGYDSVVGEDARLSGGEAQRVAIARALLADTEILVLDEATAFVDPEAEAAIYDALSALVAGRTVLFVAHRLQTVVEADQIVVLDGGRIVQRGTHRELLQAEGVYRELWRACAEPAVADPGPDPGPDAGPDPDAGLEPDSDPDSLTRPIR